MIFQIALFVEELRYYSFKQLEQFNDTKNAMCCKNLYQISLIIECIFSSLFLKILAFLLYFSIQILCIINL